MNQHFIPIVEVKRKRKANHGRLHFVYRIWAGDRIIYVGRSNETISPIIRRHFFHGNYTQIWIDIDRVTKIEYQRHKTYSDTRVYQIYYIHKFFPTTQVHEDKNTDGVSFNLPVVKWERYSPIKFEQWKKEAHLIKEGKAKQAKEIKMYYSRLLQEEKKNLKEVRREAKLDKMKQAMLEEMRARIKAEEK